MDLKRGVEMVKRPRKRKTSNEPLEGLQVAQSGRTSVEPSNEKSSNHRGIVFLAEYLASFADTPTGRGQESKADQAAEQRVQVQEHVVLDVCGSVI